MPRKKKDYGFKSFEKPPIPDNRHIRITLAMMESKAWKQLSSHAKEIYCYMKAKYNGKNENDISITYAEGRDLMNERTFVKYVDQLIESGFIKIIHQGWTTRTPNIYGFSEQWQIYGTGRFNVKERRKRVKK